jgi:glycosyltransferase involved in cell wall biosynthesis
MADRNGVEPSSPTVTLPGAQPALDAATQTAVAQYWFCNATDSSGHSDGNRAFLTALERHGINPAIYLLTWAASNHAGLPPADAEMLHRQRRRRYEGPQVAVHSYPPFARNFIEPGVPNVQRAVFETDRIPPVWLTPLLDRDEIWVPCQFNYDSFIKGGVPEERLRIVGDAIDTRRFRPGLQPWPIDTPEGAFVFLSNFDFSERKGWQQLLTGWAKAFGKHDDVCLLLKVGSFYTDTDAVVDRIERFIREELGAGAADNMAPIRFLTDLLPVPAMPRLYAAADAYVLPSRGEGVGRPYMEAMATGIPTVGSNWSGNTEFMHPEETWLIDGEVVDVAEDAELANDLYFGHRWFEADTDELARVLQEIAGNPEAARAKGAAARDRLEEEFGTATIARRLDELARAAWEAHSERRLQPVHLAVRGPAGSVDSLAVGNDALSGAELRAGRNVHIVANGAWELKATAPTISQSWPPQFDPGSQGPTVLVLPWEFGVAPDEWVGEVRRRVDRVWVPSNFIREGYIASGMPPHVVEVIPSGADVDLFTPDGPAHELPSTAGTTFLFVGGSTWRKGIDKLLEGWRLAFGPDDDVQLVIKDFGVNAAYKTSHNRDLIQSMQRRSDMAPIVYIDDDLPHDALPALYRAADCVVLPYRAEGFCLPAVEAMACGVPVIHNGAGPTGEFVADIGGWPLSAKRVPTGADIKLPKPVAGLAYYVHEVDPAELAERMRAVAADPEARAEKGRAGIEQARNYTWARYVEGARASLAQLADEGLPLAREIRRTEIESRTHVALLAADWNDPSAWTPAFDAFVDAFGAGDDVTLALWVDGDPDTVGAAIMGHLAGRDESTLPDLALVQPSKDVTLIGLASTADAVLVGRPMEVTERPDLLRRALRVLTPGDVAGWAAEL